MRFALGKGGGYKYILMSRLQNIKREDKIQLYADRIYVKIFDALCEFSVLHIVYLHFENHGHVSFR